MVRKKLIILIPAYNEEKTVANVILNIPSLLEVNKKVILIDDGSLDNTVNLSKKLGAKVISNKKNQGLGVSFKVGLKEALRKKAEIIVILDADGQYDPKNIKKLIAPIFNYGADFVLGNRFLFETKYELGFLKRFGNKMLSIFISKILLRLENVYDTQSSFRAFNRKCGIIIKNTIKAKYNYAQEMFIIAHFHGFKVHQIPINCYKRVAGKSKLIKSPPFHFLKILLVSLRTFIKLKIIAVMK